MSSVLSVEMAGNMVSHTCFVTLEYLRDRTLAMPGSTGGHKLPSPSDLRSHLTDPPIQKLYFLGEGAIC